MNLSEALNAVPGIVVQNRQNYAQDLQISSRGFGARSAFGVRGLRLIADGIPATMPDGQGQAASFSLDTAERIEVLRGPFASMYGNSSGGVIQIFTADGPPQPTLDGRLHRGSFQTSKWALRYGGQHGPLNVNAVDEPVPHRRLSRSQRRPARPLARRSSSWTRAAPERSRSSPMPSTSPRPKTRSGSLRAQVQQNPRQATAVAYQFNTRKSVSQNQLGLVHDLKITSRDTLQTRVYVGDRQVTQYLSIPVAVQAAVTHSGGVVDLDRGYGGAGVRWSHAAKPAGMPLDVHVGVDYERMSENRRGFINTFGTAGALKRDEDDTVQSTDVYAQAEWRVHRARAADGRRAPQPRSLQVGRFLHQARAIRTTAAPYVTCAPRPSLAATYDLTPEVKIYANAGKGFETPTFAELAYKSDGTPGLNFALRPSVSRHREIGAKMLLGDAGRVTVALYRIDVEDEIVVDTSSGRAHHVQERRAHSAQRRRSRVAGPLEKRLGSRARLHAPEGRVPTSFHGRNSTGLGPGRQSSSRRAGDDVLRRSGMAPRHERFPCRRRKQVQRACLRRRPEQRARGRPHRRQRARGIRAAHEAAAFRPVRPPRQCR